VSETEFDVTVSFGVIRGPFKARLTIGEGEVSVVPVRLPLIGRSSLFRPVSVRSGDVEAVDADRWYRSGLRFQTTSGALDHIVVIPDDSRDRAAIHWTLIRHGFKVV
jgi:hypothetical protein